MLNQITENAVVLPILHLSTQEIPAEFWEGWLLNMYQGKVVKK